MFICGMKMFKSGASDGDLTMRDASVPVTSPPRGDELTTRLCQLAYL